MDVTVCDATAFEYWRIPPIVHLLLAGDGVPATLRGKIRLDELEVARSQFAASHPLCARFLRPNPASRASGDAVDALRPVIPLLAANHDGPIDVLVGRSSDCHASTLIHPRQWESAALSHRAVQIASAVSVLTPDRALLQIASRASLVRVVLLGSELCGSFAVYDPPEPLRSLLQAVQDRGGIPALAGWRPCLTAGGRLSGLWSRPALTTPKNLARLADAHRPRKGSQTLARAAGLIVVGAASPFEVQAGALLGLPRQLGAEGFAGFSYNRRVVLTRDARLLAQRNSCYCDLYWESGLDVECQSALVHQTEASFLSDSDRTAALRRMGIDVLPITYSQLADPARFEALSKTVSRLLGKRAYSKSARQKQLATQLRGEVLVDWTSLPRV